ncbi:FAD binding domain-containing protein [Seiridium cupressi]
MAAKEFKVILAGASFASLALANMLEKFEIDYVILESHEEIALPVGASIGLFPSGLRVLNQIGCYEPIISLAQEDLKLSYTRDRDGKVISILHDMVAHLKKHGERETLLVVSGPESRAYWFLFVKLSATQYGKNIPKFTKDDEADCVKEHVNLPVTDEIMFGQIYAKHLTSALTLLHEVVYKKWGF